MGDVFALDPILTSRIWRMRAPKSAKSSNSSTFCNIGSILNFVDSIDQKCCVLFNSKFLCYQNIRYSGCDVASRDLSASSFWILCNKHSDASIVNMFFLSLIYSLYIKFEGSIKCDKRVAIIFLIFFSNNLKA